MPTANCSSSARFMQRSRGRGSASAPTPAARSSSTHGPKPGRRPRSPRPRRWRSAMPRCGSAPASTQPRPRPADSRRRPHGRTSGHWWPPLAAGVPHRAATPGAAASERVKCASSEPGSDRWRPWMQSAWLTSQAARVTTPVSGAAAAAPDSAGAVRPAQRRSPPGPPGTPRCDDHALAQQWIRRPLRISPPAPSPPPITTTPLPRERRIRSHRGSNARHRQQHPAHRDLFIPPSPQPLPLSTRPHLPDQADSRAVTKRSSGRIVPADAGVLRSSTASRSKRPSPPRRRGGAPPGTGGGVAPCGFFPPCARAADMPSTPARNAGDVSRAAITTRSPP
jgi:hypothetical protein